MKILNLYAGIGGNRKLWGDQHEITAVEYDEETAALYKSYFPSDEIIIADAHEYLIKHFKEFDFIWSSPPCPTHSDIRRCGVHAGKHDAVYPDMALYQEIILLKNFANNNIKFCIENVIPYYKPLIDPDVTINRHNYWSNFKIHNFSYQNNVKIIHVNPGDTIFGFNLNGTRIKDKRKALRNMVDPELGLHILNCAMNYQPPINIGLFK